MTNHDRHGGHRPMHRGGAILAVLAMAMVCAGCGTPMLYNEARDKQGQDLKKAASEVKLLPAVEKLDAKYAALDQLEIATAKTRLATTRDFEMAQVAMSSKGSARTASLQDLYVDPLINQRFKDLVGSVPSIEEMTDFVQDDAEASRRERLVAESMRTFNATSNLKIQDCAEASAVAAPTAPPTLRADVLATVPPKKRGAAQLLLKQLLERCAAQSDGALDTSQAGGEIKHLVDALARDRQEAAGYRTRLKQQADKLKAEQARYDEAVKATLPNPSGYLAQLSDIAEKLQKGIEAIRKQAGAGDLAQAHAEAIAKLDALNVLLEAFASGETDAAKLSDKERQAVMIVRLIPSVADEADKLFKEAKRARVAPFLLAKEHQRLAVEGFEKHMALVDSRSRLRRQQLAAALAEAHALSQARLALHNETVRVDLSRTMAEVVGATGGRSPQARFGLYRSFAFYFDDAYRHRITQTVLDLNVQSLAYDVEIEQSRTAALMWENLTTHMSVVLADYHASGVKTSEIAEFLKAAGLFYIGSQTGN